MSEIQEYPKWVQSKLGPVVVPDAAAEMAVADGRAKLIEIFGVGVARVEYEGCEPDPDEKPAAKPKRGRV